MSERNTVIDKVIVPVAGLGTRLLPATKSQPKEMLPVGRKPVVQYVVEEMVDQGLRYLLLVTGATKVSIENHFDTDPQLMERLLESENEDLLRQVDFQLEGAQIFYTRQTVKAGARKPAGLGDAIRHGRAFVGREPFVVALGDTIIRANGEQTLIERLCDTHLRNNASATIAVWQVEQAATRRYGVVKPAAGADMTEPFAIEDIIEKPHPADAPSRYAVAARYVFGPEIFDALDVTLPGHGGEIQLTDAIRHLVRTGKSVWCVPLKPEETRFDIGNPETYFKAFLDFAFRDGQVGKSVRMYARNLLTQYSDDEEAK
jgi:UTP--glucose-1-phosphate uridylyltransferase